jgi:hypothetical protein
MECFRLTNLIKVPSSVGPGLSLEDKNEAVIDENAYILQT